MIIKPLQIDNRSKILTNFDWGLVANNSEYLFVHDFFNFRIAFYKQISVDNIKLLGLITYKKEKSIIPADMSFEGNNLFLLIDSVVQVYNISKVYQVDEFQNIDIGTSTHSLSLTGSKIFLHSNFIMIGKIYYLFWLRVAIFKTAIYFI